MHPELEKLLKQYSDLLGIDLNTYHIYGSPMRPMGAAWARIEGAVFIQVDQRATGFHTYVATSSPLNQEVVKSYELRLVALGKTSL